MTTIVSGVRILRERGQVTGSVTTKENGGEILIPASISLNRPEVRQAVEQLEELLTTKAREIAQSLSAAQTPPPPAKAAVPSTRFKQPVGAASGHPRRRRGDRRG